MTNPNDPEEYVVQFASHGDPHQIEIDLECFSKAIMPYLITELSKEKKL